MSDGGVSDYEMPNRTWPQPADVSGIPDTAFSALLEGATPEADAPAPLQHVADLLAALRAGPAADETAGRAAAAAEYRRRAGAPLRSSRPRRVRPAVFLPMLRTRAGRAATVAVVGLGGIVVAAYAGALPAAAQQVAHDAIGAPQASNAHDSPSAGHGSTPVGPDASGHAKFGLCTAYAHGREHGSEAKTSVAFRNLVKAAGGAANVASYCARVPHPGALQSDAGDQGGQPGTADRTHSTGKPPHP
jgi:hypothetical protein